MKKYLATGLLVLAMPFAAQALSIEEIQKQIAALLEQLAQLQQQIQELQSSDTILSTTVSGGAASTAAGVDPAGNVCPVFSLVLSLGSRGDAVSALQRFLSARGYLSADSITGYYGPLTEGAVRKLQTQHEVVSSGDAASTGWGVVGRQTSALIKELCVAAATQFTPSPTLPVSTSTATSSCLQILAPTTTCSTGWKSVVDAAGCAVGYQCVVRPTYYSSGGGYSCSSGYTLSGNICIPIVGTPLPTCPVVSRQACPPGQRYATSTPAEIEISPGCFVANLTCVSD